MTLTTIEYGSLASSALLNDNFEYLDGRVTTVSEALSSNVASINANIASVNSSLKNTINSSVSTAKTQLTNSINSLSNTIANNGLYITTYINGTSWYREYFSNSSKTTRVWLEQGGVTTINDYNTTVSLVKSFTNTNYTLMITSNTNGFPMIISKAAGSFVAKGSNTSVKNWFACGK